MNDTHQPNTQMNGVTTDSTAFQGKGAATIDSDASEKLALPEWEVLGFWNYDGADAVFLPAGLHLVEQPGNALGKNWQRRLEMKEHARLPNRQRTLWPVYINRKEKQICAPYPGYPSYTARIDLPRDDASGTYHFSGCSPGQ